MDSILKYLQNPEFATIASDPRALFVVGVILVLAVIFRWKGVLLLFFAIGGALAVLRYSGIGETHSGEIDMSLLVFAGGSVVVGVILIYFLFIRGD